MSIPASGLRPSCRPQEYPQTPVTPPCDTTTTSCSDPRTGGPLRATNLPQICENGPVMGHAERQEQYYRDTYASAEDPSRTCSQRRIEQLLRGGSDEVCLPVAQGIPDRPTMTVQQLAESQMGTIARRTAMHLGADIAVHIGIDLGTHALASMATGAGLLGVGAALPPLGMALGIVMTASSLMAMSHEVRHLDAQDRAALRALAIQWETYQHNVNVNARAQIEGRMHALGRGIEFVRNGLLDDPFVQRQIQSDPYIRLGVRMALEAQQRASAAATTCGTSRPGQSPHSTYAPRA